MEGLPGGEDEGEGRGAGCLASHQTRRCPHTGAGTGEIYTWMDTYIKQIDGCLIEKWEPQWIVGQLDGWMDGLPLDDRLVDG